MPKAKTETNEETYSKLAASFAKEKGVSQSDKFGKGLRLHDKVFAMLVKGELVVKLPEAEVAKLIANKTGKLFMHGKKTMKEWLVVAKTDLPLWKKIAGLAKKFAEK
jgi:hypothetical protein